MPDSTYFTWKSCQLHSSDKRQHLVQNYFPPVAQLESAYKFHLCTCSCSEQNGRRSNAFQQEREKQLSLCHCCELLQGWNTSFFSKLAEVMSGSVKEKNISWIFNYACGVPVGTIEFVKCQEISFFYILKLMIDMISPLLGMY